MSHRKIGGLLEPTDTQHSMTLIMMEIDYTTLAGRCDAMQEGGQGMILGTLVGVILFIL